jgi:hypothetical protein
MKINKNVLSHRIDNELVLLNVLTGDYFTLNEVGAAIWKGIADGMTLETVIGRIHEEFDIDDREQIIRDAEEIVKALKEEGLVIEE